MFRSINKVVCCMLVLPMLLISCNGAGGNQVQSIPDPSGNFSLSSIMITTGVIAAGIFTVGTGGLGPLIANSVADIVADGATSGMDPSSNNDAIYFKALNKNLDNIVSQLTAEDAQLQSFIQQFENGEAASLQSQLVINISNLSNNFNQFADVIYKFNVADGDAFFGNSLNPISESTMQYLAIIESTTLEQNVPNLSSQDSYEETLSDDATGFYNAALQTPFIPNVNGVIAQTFQALLNQATGTIVGLNNNGTSVSSSNPATINIISVKRQFDNAINIYYIRILMALTQAYRVDQLRLALSFVPRAAIAPIAYIDPVDSTDYDAALADLNYAYNQRINYLNNSTIAIKQQFDNQYNLNLLYSPSLAQNCNFSESGIEQSTESQIQNAQESWDGNTLQLTCNYTNQAGESTTMVSSQQLGMACAENNTPGAWNVEALNGNIYCGPLNWNTLIVNSTNTGGFADSEEYNLTNMYNITVASPYDILQWDSTYASPLPLSTLYEKLGITSTDVTPLQTAQNIPYFRAINQGYNLVVPFTYLSSLSYSLGIDSTSIFNVFTTAMFDGNHYWVVRLFAQVSRDLLTSDQSVQYYIQPVCLKFDDACSPGTAGDLGPSLVFTNGDSMSVGSYVSADMYDRYWVHTNYSVYANSQPWFQARYGVNPYTTGTVN